MHKPNPVDLTATEVLTIALYQSPTKTSPSKQTKKDLIGSVQRALRILELLAHYPEGLNAKQVAVKLHLNLSTCYHLLNTLQHENYVIKDPDTYLFRLGGKIGYNVFDRISSAQVVRQLTPHVHTLQEITQETAYLSVWDGREIILSSIVEAPQTVRVKSLAIGDIGSNHGSALGKAILAHFDDETYARYFAGRLMPAFTPNTITEPTTLRNTLHAVRQQGYALDYEEFMLEVHCIGAPIFDAHNNITASLAISLPVSRSNGKREQLIDNVKQVAGAASRTLQVLGYLGPASKHERKD